MEYALKLENVTKEYKDFKLDNISVNVPRGVIMGFIGENGAGKSTTIKLILDLIRRDAGIITVLGTDVCELKSIKEKIGVVMDESCFPENLNVEEINKIMKRIYSTWNEERFFEYMKKF
ncbi:MAG TPA: ABC transporter, partial [Clostridiales bacterium]|nr:ABC transporter [Clostridiales bacterium]